MSVTLSDLLVSFDVVSLFTKVLLKETLDLLGSILASEVTDLFQHMPFSTYFLFSGQYFEQTDEVAMGSPLSPVIVNFYMEAFERLALEQATYFFRYVDDTFLI